MSFYFEYDGTDSHARCVHTWGDGGIYNHRLEFDVVLKQTKVTNSLGQSTLHFWNDDGLVFRTVDPLGCTKETTFSEFNQPLAEIDELGQVATYAYDDRGNQILMVTPDEAKLEYVYNELDLPVRATDALGKFWFWEYNSLGQLTKRKDPTDRETRFEYAVRRLAVILDPAGNATHVSYDKSGNLDTVRSPDGGQSRWQFDLLGRPLAVTDPRGNVQRREYDALGRLTRVIEPDGNLRTLRYDAIDNLVYVKDLQREVRFTYQGMGRLASRREAGTTIGFSYNTEEDLIAITNEHGSVYRFELDERGSIAKEFGFDNIRRIYTRDNAGRVVRVERASGLITSYDYDAASRVTGVRHSDDSMEQYVYRKDGQLIEATNDCCTVQFERDAVGRILKEHQGDFWVSSEYGALGLRTAMRSAFGAFQTIDRNSMGDVTGMQYRDESADPSKILWETNIQRDQMGLELERTLPGGVRSRWERDKLGRPLRHQIVGGGGQGRDVKYEWGVNDRLQKIVDAHRGTTTFEHDELGNLAAATYGDGTVELRMPDAVGNLFRTRDRKDRKYGLAGQLLEARTDRGIIRYEYDGEGNLIHKITPEGHWIFRWNAVGMLASVTRPDGTLIVISYDPMGRRVSKTLRGCITHWYWNADVPLHVQHEYASDASGQPAIELQEVYSPDVHRGDSDSESLQEGDDKRGWANTSNCSINQALTTWLFTPDSVSPFAVTAEADVRSVVTDYLGTPISMVDSKGETVWTSSLTIYGKSVGSDNRTDSCPFRWPGQYEDEETGLHYNRFRYYDPDAGGYISQDPLRLASDEANLFRYTSDPNSIIDPFGLFGSGKGTHEAQVRVFDSNQQLVHNEPFRSGNMTPAENSLGFPRNTLATHTEARAVSGIPLSPGQRMEIAGQYPPCSSCQGRMRHASSNGNLIEYTWVDDVGKQRKVAYQNGRKVKSMCH